MPVVAERFKPDDKLGIGEFDEIKWIKLIKIKRCVEVRAGMIDEDWGGLRERRRLSV